jgi:hypothetical protein
MRYCCFSVERNNIMRNVNTEFKSNGIQRFDRECSSRNELFEYRVRTVSTHQEIEHRDFFLADFLYISPLQDFGLNCVDLMAFQSFVFIRLSFVSLFTDDVIHESPSYPGLSGPRCLFQGVSGIQ